MMRLLCRRNRRIGTIDLSLLLLGEFSDCFVGEELGSILESPPFGSVPLNKAGAPT
jgi:hypothetical protein